MGKACRGPGLILALSLLGLGCSTDEAAERPPLSGIEQRTPAPAFSYGLYCDALGRFTYDGAALVLVQRPAHLARVYADAARGEPRAKELVRELEQVFQDFGVWAANTTARLRCLTVPELIEGCLGNWTSMNALLGNSPEAMRLKEVTATAYRAQAEKRGVQNRVIVAAVNLLLAGGMASATLGRTAAAEAGGTSREFLAREVALGKAEVPQPLAARVGGGVAEGASSQILRFSERNLQKGFTKHGADFGLAGPWNPSRAADFSKAINQHINRPGVRVISGTYRGNRVTHYLDPSTGLNVMADPVGNYVSGWRLGVEQRDSVLATGRLF